MRYYLNHVAVTCALGNTTEEVARQLFATQTRAESPLRPSEAYSPGRPFFLGQISQELPQIPDALAAYKCRNNQLLLHCAQQIETQLQASVERYGAERVGLVLGTSTSGIYESELAASARAATGSTPGEFNFIQQQLSGGTDFLANIYNLGGPTSTISTACSSSANALASAARLLDLDLCDAVLVGGADTLCHFTVQGFAALEAMSAGLANPMSANRDGINIGEAGVLMLLSKQPSQIALLGVGSSSDAHHISAPHPEGKGARAAMHAALQQGGVAPDSIDYVNLHGTATPQNDAAESRAVAGVLGVDVPCSSSKPMTGHTLGAAGILEVALCYLHMHDEYNPLADIIRNLWDGAVDPDLAPISILEESTGSRARHVLSNSFAFGGNNASVLLGA